jgi:hypothetical protein
MDEPRVPPDQAVEAFRQDARAEYYAILDVITGFDQRIMIVKGWSVTLSLAALGLASSRATTRSLRLPALPDGRFGLWTRC